MAIAPAVSAPVAAPRRGAVPRWAVFALLALAALATRLPGLGDAAHDFDEQLYHLGGLELLGGHLPYVDVWDRKPFGLFAIYAVAALLGGDSPLGYQLLAAGCAALVAGQVYALARRFADGVASFFAALFALIAFPLFSAPQGQSEVFYLPLLLGMLLLALEAGRRERLEEAVRPMRLAMLLGGFAIQIKYMALPQCLFFGLVALWQSHRLGAGPAALARQAAIFALIGLAPTLAVAALYAATGHFAAFWFANFESIFLRGRLPLEASAQYVRWIAWGSSWLWALAAIGAVLVLAGRRAAAPGYGMVAGFMVASLAALVMIGNIYVHYFVPVAVTLAVLGAPAMSGRIVNRLLAVVALWLAFNFTHFDALAARGAANRVALPQLADIVQPYVGPAGPCLFVYEGPVALYRATGSCLPSRFVYPDHLNNALEMPAIGVDTGAEVGRIFAARPGAVIDSALTPAARRNPVTARIVAEALAADYTRIAQVDFPPRRLDVFVRNDLLQSPPRQRRAGSQGTIAP